MKKTSSLLTLLLLSGCGAFLNQESSAPLPPEENSVVTPPKDSSVDIINSVTAIASKKIKVEFKEAINASSGGTVANYSLNQDLIVTQVSLSADASVVEISVDKHMLPLKTTLTISGVKTQTNKSIDSLKLLFTPNTKVAFLSTASGLGNLNKWPGSNNKSGIAAAHEICRTEAKAAGFEGDFMAFISDSQTNAKTVLSTPTGAWITTHPDHLLFAKDTPSLLEGKTLAPLNYTAFGTTDTAFTSGFGMATGTNYDGVKLSGSSPAKYCNDWISEDSAIPLDGSGNSRSTGAFWVSRRGPLACNSLTKLYCLQKGNGMEIEEALPTNAKKVFVTSVKGKGDFRTWQPDMTTNLSMLTGEAASSAICSIRAQAANLPNAAKYKAWISVGGMGAMQRFVNKTGPYYNTQGALIAKNLQDLADGKMDAGISYDEFGNTLAPGTDSVFTGTKAGGSEMNLSTSPSFLAIVPSGIVNHCDNWQGSNDQNQTIKHTVSMGFLGITSTAWTQYFESPNNCAIDAPIICIEDI